MRTFLFSVIMTLTTVSPICLAQTGTFGAPVSKEALAKAQAKAEVYRQLAGAAEYIVTVGDKICTDPLMPPNGRVKLMAEYARMLDVSGSTPDNIKPEDRKIADALQLLSACE